jgi:hypothetical protein
MLMLIIVKVMFARVLHLTGFYDKAAIFFQCSSYRAGDCALVGPVKYIPFFSFLFQ